MASPADNGGHFPDRAYLSLTGGTLTGPLIAPAGTAALPGVGVGSTAIGLYSTGSGATGVLGFSTNGVSRATIDTSSAIFATTFAIRSTFDGAAAIYASGGSSATIRCDGTGAAALNIPSGGGTFGLAITPNGGIATATTAITTASVTEYAGFAPPPTLTTGTDTAMANGTSWFAPVYIGTNRTLTGIGYLVGSVGGTDSVITALYTASGQAAALANSNLAGTTVGTAATFQEVPFTATYAAKCGWYWALIQANGATAKLRLGLAVGARGGTIVGGTFGTLAATLTLPTTNVAAPICYVY